MEVSVIFFGGIQKKYTMHADLFVKKLKEELDKALPGEEYQELMASPYRKQYRSSAGKPQNGSVILLVYPSGGGFNTVLIERSVDNSVHSGQISLPGGRVEECDAFPRDTALRELAEEVHVERNDVRILGSLTPLYIPASNYYVQPFVGSIEYKPAFIPDPREVQKIIEAPLEHLTRPENSATMVISHKNRAVEVPCYTLGNHNVWGATAMIIREFMEVVRRAGVSLK